MSPVTIVKIIHPGALAALRARYCGKCYHDADMRQETAYFEDQELVLIYIAGRLKEALAVERVLDAGAVDYAVVPTPYMSGILFRSQRMGAFFYVTTHAEEQARALMRQNGFQPFKKNEES